MKTFTLLRLGIKCDNWSKFIRQPIDITLKLNGLREKTYFFNCSRTKSYSYTVKFLSRTYTITISKDFYVFYSTSEFFPGWHTT